MDMRRWESRRPSKAADKLPLASRRRRAGMGKGHAVRGPRKAGEKTAAACSPHCVAAGRTVREWAPDRFL